MASPSTELAALLAEDPDDADERMATAFDRAAGDRAGRVVLFGAGGLGARMAAVLAADGRPAVGMADNGPGRWGAEVEGLTVEAPAEALERWAGDAAFVVTIFTPAAAAVRRQLEEAGALVVPWQLLALRHHRRFLPYLRIDHPGSLLRRAGEVGDAFALLGDDRSRHHYVGEVAWRLTFDPGRLAPHRPIAEQYFDPEVVTVGPDERFVDGGAYDGDTVRELLRRTGGRTGGVLAVEADPDNAARLDAWVATLPAEQRSLIATAAVAVADRRATVRFDAAGTTGSALADAGLEVPAAPLDELAADLRPTLVKLDLEGAEPLALTGAAGLLRAGATRWAVCLYHQLDHLWTLPLQIERTAPGRYRMVLRAYGPDGWESVLYALPGAG